MTQREELAGTWSKYRGSLRLRLALGLVALTVALVPIPFVAPQTAVLLAVAGVLSFGTILISGVFAIAWLAAAVAWSGVFDGSHPRLWIGVAIAFVGLVATRARTRQGVPYLAALGLVWIGLLLVHPLIFLLLAIVPLGMIAFDRRRQMRSRPHSIEPGPMPRNWGAWARQVEANGGARHVGFVWFDHGEAGTAYAGVFRLADGRGFAIGLVDWLVVHFFGDRVLFSTPGRWTVTLPDELGQQSRGDDLMDVIRSQRRVLARLAKSGQRADRLTDEEAMGRIADQFRRDVEVRAQAGWLTVLRAMLDEEMNARDHRQPELLDSAKGRERLEAWAAS